MGWDQPQLAKQVSKSPGYPCKLTVYCQDILVYALEIVMLYIILYAACDISVYFPDILQYRGYVQAVRLLVIDEIHLLGDERGPSARGHRVSY